MIVLLFVLFDSLEKIMQMMTEWKTDFINDKFTINFLKICQP